MSKASDNANAVVYTVAQVCDLYRVKFTREQSKAISVTGGAGRTRPMFIGSWKDDQGQVHYGGKPDILARPRIFVYHSETHSTDEYMSVPLWIECKSGDGRMTHEQHAFKKWVEDNGDFYLLIHDDVRPLMTWFDEHGVKK